MNNTKHTLGIILVTCIVMLLFMFFIKPKYDQSFYKNVRIELQKEETKSKAKIDSLINIIKSDSLRLIDSLKVKNQQIFLLKNEYQNAILIIKKHEKALNTYRNGNFNDRFSTFTELISSQDTIQRL